MTCCLVGTVSLSESCITSTKTCRGNEASFGAKVMQ
jgi:hypothetical protein